MSTYTELDEVARREKIADFISRTDADEATAIEYLRAEDWIVYEAVYSYRADLKACGK